jgi:glutamate/tyrosine decarboxylase-like PLP-dependent enzyme
MITPEGLGGEEVLRLWRDVLGPACLSVDHPRYLAYIPSAPTTAAAAFDMLVGASSVYSGSWLEGSGAVYAENQTLRWVADLAGLPPGAGGGNVACSAGVNPVIRGSTACSGCLVRGKPSGEREVRNDGRNRR